MGVEWKKLAYSPHGSDHLVGGPDSIFPADPGADKYLMWDDDPGELVWSTPEGGGGGVPAGVILMWSGTIANIPAGWVICDGNNGTPDLTGRFIVHADADSGGTYNPGNTGGADTMSHTHDLAISGTEVNAGTTAYRLIDIGGEVHALIGGGASAYDAYTKTTTEATNEENRPPYYALAYIMKT